MNMNIVRTAVIGGGVAGLTYAIFDEGSTVFDANPLGQLQPMYILGPRLIHNCGFTRALLKKMGYMNYNIHTAKIGYLYESGSVYDLCDDRFKRQYSLLTRGYEDYEPSFLSGGQVEIECIAFRDFDHNESYVFLFKDILDRLQRDGRMIAEKVAAIGHNEMFTDGSDSHYSYAYIVNTTDIRQFRKMLSKAHFAQQLLFEVKDKRFIVATYNDQMRSLSNKYAYIYSIREPFTRVTFQKDYVVYEVDGSQNETGTMTQFLKDNRQILLDDKTLPIQIINSYQGLWSLCPNMFLLGRYAQWNHSIKLDSLENHIANIHNVVL